MFGLAIASLADGSPAQCQEITMGQEEIIASQEKTLSPAAGLFEHLNHLQRLNTRNVLDAVRQRQAKTFAPLSQGQFKQPTAAHWQEYFTDLSQRSLLFWDTL